MLDLSKYIKEKEFYTALKEMFSSLDERVISNPKYETTLNKIIEPDRIITFDVKWLKIKNTKLTKTLYL